jgi:hypothetical protein
MIQSAAFDEHNLARGDELYVLFESALLISMARAALGLPEGAPLRGLRSWINRYKASEYIPPHKDVTGDVHILISIHQPPPENGGTLFVEDRNGRQPVRLTTGDAAIFLASKLTHDSEVLVPTREQPAPTRIVAVGRYYF